MGKRNKNKCEASAVKNKKHKSVQCHAAEESEVTTIPEASKTLKVKSKKKNNVIIKDDLIKNEISNDDKVPLTNSPTTAAQVEGNENKKNYKENAVTELPQKSKKHVFNEEGQAVECSKETKIQKGIKNNDLEQEDDVKDEDIDTFCDEINEEDNLQYLNWIEQIEAKLGNNKKKPK